MSLHMEQVKELLIETGMEMKEAMKLIGLTIADFTAEQLEELSEYLHRKSDE